jgi:hypothetical protein
MIDPQNQQANPFEEEEEDFNEDEDVASPDRLFSSGGRRSVTGAGKKQRQENGLVELTKKFIDLIKRAPQQCVDLNDAVAKLEV